MYYKTVLYNFQF